MPRPKPEYTFSDFKRCCIENPADVVPWKPALDDADKIFGLKTKSELLNFIGNDGLEELTFYNKSMYYDKLGKPLNIFIDEYEFISGSKLGYIAFMHNKKIGKWAIKSFHLSKNSNLTLAFALNKAGFKLIGED